MKDGVRAVGIDVHLDPRVHEMGPHRPPDRSPGVQRAVGDAIVLADLPLLLDAQDLVESDARNGREGRALAGRLNPKAGVVGGQIAVADEGVGRLEKGRIYRTCARDIPLRIVLLKTRTYAMYFYSLD